MMGMRGRQSLTAAATTAIFFLSSMSKPGAATTAIEHTFVVSQVNMTRLCNETLVTVVNGQFPGPMVEVTEGDSVAVHVVNKSPYNLTIHCAPSGQVTTSPTGSTSPGSKAPCGGMLTLPPSGQVSTAP
nr:unnamed protein product [Digitaria exilis]